MAQPLLGGPNLGGRFNTINRAFEQAGKKKKPKPKRPMQGKAMGQQQTIQRGMQRGPF